MNLQGGWLRRRSQVKALCAVKLGDRLVWSAQYVFAVIETGLGLLAIIRSGYC